MQPWGIYDSLLLGMRVGDAEQPERLEALLRAHTQQLTFSPKLWNDAYLAAFAQLGGLQLLTFDHGFSQFTGLQVTILQ